MSKLFVLWFSQRLCLTMLQQMNGYGKYDDTKILVLWIGISKGNT